MQHRFAATNGKTTLYKFRFFREAVHKARVREIVVDHRIYFSRRSEMNDPFDLSPVIRLDGAHDDPSLRIKLMENAKVVWKRNEPQLAEQELNARADWFRTCDLAKFEADAGQTAGRRIERDYWVFSLAGNRTHPMLWSHYADGHSGLCLHFLSDGTSAFGAAQEVYYRQDRPTVGFPFDDRGELLEKGTLWKGAFWHYEDEYRFLRYPDTDFSDVGLKFDRQHAHYRPEWLIGITVGACMADAEVTQVLELAARHDPALPVCRAQTTLTYELAFERIG